MAPDDPAALARVLVELPSRLPGLLASTGQLEAADLEGPYRGFVGDLLR